MVQHGVVAAELRVFAAQGVEAVRAGHDDLAIHLLDAIEQIFERLHVLRGELLEQEFVARAAGRVTVAGLAFAQHQILHARRGKQLGNRFGRLLRPVLVGTGAAHPEQVLEAFERVDVLAVDRHVEVDFVDPVGAVLGVLSPRVALVLQVLEQHAEFAGELRLHHHLVATHIDDVVDVFDVHWTLFDTCAAGGAGPQHVGIDDATLFEGADHRSGRLQRGVGGNALEARLRHVLVVVMFGLDEAALGRLKLFGHRRFAGQLFAVQEIRRLGEHVVAQVHDHELGREGLAGIPGRALRLAATAFGARGEVQVALPGEILDFPAAQHGVLGGIFEVHHLAIGLDR